MHPVVPCSEQTVLNHSTTAAGITYTKGRVIKTHAGPKVKFDPLPPSIKSLYSHWIYQLISALAHLHSHLFIHCDISCRNIVVTSSLNTKLIDFGSSAILGNESAVNFDWCGCLSYSSSCVMD